jgi:hypothetical protein
MRSGSIVHEKLNLLLLSLGKCSSKLLEFFVAAVFVSWSETVYCCSVGSSPLFFREQLSKQGEEFGDGSFSVCAMLSSEMSIGARRID